MENDELAQHLESLQREDCYRVDAVMKESGVEITQRVYFVGTNGAENGPFIRKYIQQGAGLGSAYERIWRAQLAGRRFKYIPDILECYSRSDQMVVVMEYVRGETLQEVVYQHDPSLKLARDVFPRLCDAVSELHTEFDPPIIHRDLKPSNVILSGEGLALIDFGISRDYREGAQSDTTRFGTREFAPPEQFGFGQTTVRSDIYSLGLVLYYLLTETIPDSAIRESEFADPRIPEPVRGVIAQAAAFDPAQRFHNAHALRNAFLKSLEQAGVTDLDKRYRPGASCDERYRPGASRPETPNVAPARFGDSGQGNAHDVSVSAWQGNFRAKEDISGQQPEPAASRDAASSLPAGFNKVVIALVVTAGVVLAIFVLMGIASVQPRSSSASAQASSESAQVTQELKSDEHDDSEGSGNRAESAEASGQQDSNAPTETQVAEDLQISKTPKNGFDPATNRTVAVAGVDFQIPSYFFARVADGVNDSTTYFAEEGSSVAMLLTKEYHLDEAATREEFQIGKDAYLSAFARSVDYVDEVTSYSDCELAGYSARIATMRGTINGVELTSKMAFFFNPELQSIGSITFGQTANVQFDYSADFAKVVTSAKPA